MNNEIAVKTENLVKTFQGAEIIKGCNMTVMRGTIYGFLGANGAGKTTIFKMLTGLLTPTSGKAEVLGMDIAVQRNVILRSIGSLIETPIFYEHMSATENLSLHLEYMDYRNTNIGETLEYVGLINTGTQPVSKFSLGMRQRLGIARAIIHRPKLLILDEPINGLDPMGIRKMRDLFLDLVQNQGMTILVSSHILSEVEHIADIVGVIVNGAIVHEIALSEIKNQFPHGLEEYFFNIMNGGNGDV